MAAVTICSDFGAQKLKSDTVCTVSPSISHEVLGLDAMIFVFWMFLRPLQIIVLLICSVLWAFFWGWGSHRSFIIRTLALFWASRETTGGMTKVSLATMLLNTGGGDKGWCRETRQLALELMQREILMDAQTSCGDGEEWFCSGWTWRNY